MKRSRLIFIFFFFLAIIGCYIFAFLTGVPLSIPAYASETFGSPNESLDTGDRLVLSTLLIIQKKDLTSPYSNSSLDLTFKIDMGESINSISDRLNKKGLLHNPDGFRNYLVYSGLDTQIQAGDFVLNTRMTPIEIAERLRDPSPQQINFGVLKGWRAEEIAATIPSSGLEMSQEDFLTSVRQNNAEGYLLPGLYQLDRSISAEVLVRNLTNAFDATITSELITGLKQNGLDLHEAVILASIVEREAVVKDEMPLISSVFINRLNIGMKLDADPTVQFAIGYNPSQGLWWTNPLSISNLEINSPYNTYLNPGLPPGPICNPSSEALRSVAFPAQTPYYYFRADCDQTGRHLFAETFQEHTENSCP